MSYVCVPYKISIFLKYWVQIISNVLTLHFRRVTLKKIIIIKKNKEKMQTFKIFLTGTKMDKMLIQN